jgi:hypothetical protein
MIPPISALSSVSTREMTGDHLPRVRPVSDHEISQHAIFLLSEAVTVLSSIIFLA